jgi:predicted RNA binding protein YcfA (HicA-like mRNA interferase family)
MPKLVIIRPLKFIKILKYLEFTERDAEGSHLFFRHKDGRTTVIPIHSKVLSRGLLRKILNDIQLSIVDYEKLRKIIA